METTISAHAKIRKAGFLRVQAAIERAKTSTAIASDELLSSVSTHETADEKISKSKETPTMPPQVKLPEVASLKAQASLKHAETTTIVASLKVLSAVSAESNTTTEKTSRSKQVVTRQAQTNLSAADHLKAQAKIKLARNSNAIEFGDESSMISDVSIPRTVRKKKTRSYSFRSGTMPSMFALLDVPKSKTVPSDNPFLHKFCTWNEERDRWDLQIGLRFATPTSAQGREFAKNYNHLFGPTYEVHEREEAVGPYRSAAIWEMIGKTFERGEREQEKKRKEREARVEADGY